MCIAIGVQVICIDICVVYVCSLCINMHVVCIAMCVDVCSYMYMCVDVCICDKCSMYVCVLYSYDWMYVLFTVMCIWLVHVYVARYVQLCMYVVYISVCVWNV